jgi:hypothetical protein
MLLCYKKNSLPRRLSPPEAYSYVDTPAHRQDTYRKQPFNAVNAEYRKLPIASELSVAIFTAAREMLPWLAGGNISQPMGRAGNGSTMRIHFLSL